MTDTTNTKSKTVNEGNEPADFEKAINATGFGLFNLILVLVALPCSIGTVYETSSISYVLPSAECDLKLTLFDKGLINAITYAGMISSAIFWGFAADTFGRKKLLVFGFLVDVLCAVGCLLSQNFYMLMIFKYLGGFVICGPFAVLMSYVTEFHGVKFRSIVVMLMGMFFTIATFILPLLAWAILPQKWHYEFFDGYIVINNWRIFLGVCGLPSLIGGICIIFFPESPKFLMSQGRNSEALETFKWIFVLNTRKSADEYPIKELVQEVPQKFTNYEADMINKNCKTLQNNAEIVDKTVPSFTDNMMNGFRQLKPMLQKPYLGHSIHVYTIQFFVLLGQNTVRLWLPQLFTSIAQYNEEHINSTEDGNLCTVIEYSVNIAKQYSSGSNFTECEVKISDEMYINTMIVAFTGIVSYAVAGSVINALGQKYILIFGLFTSGLCGLTLYFAKDSLAVLILTSIYYAIGSVSCSSLLGVIVNLFPTSLRTMIVSLAMMFGRSGALIGNLLFPIFMSFGCVPPFLLVGCVMWMGSLLCIMLPQTHKSALK